MSRAVAINDEELWDQPDAPSRPHQLPYSPAWENKRGVNLYILRMNRDVNRMLLQKGLFRLLKAHVLIIHLSVDVDLFGNVYGHLVVLSQADVRTVVKRFHKTSFFGKSIEFSEISPVIPVPIAVKRAVIGIFQEQKRPHMLLAELIGFFEEKYDQPMGISDLLKMTDVVERFAIGDMQMVRLLPYSLVWQTNLARQGCLNALPLAQCGKGCGKTRGSGARMSGSKSLTCYRVSLQSFVPAVRQVLNYHGNCMNLNTFVQCYEALVGHLPEDEHDGVYLDHLLSAVPGVHIVQQPFHSRQLVLENRPPEMGVKFADGYLNHFHREVMDMLMAHNRATVPFGEFVQTYRVHYGKMCRVADFGCTRLAELLLLFSQNVQILGIGNNRMITLTHSAQIQRFQHVVKHVQLSCGIHHVDSRSFHLLYHFVYKKPFCPVDFGVCYLEDLLNPVLLELLHVPLPMISSVPEKTALFSVNKFRDKLAALRDRKREEELDDSGIHSNEETSGSPTKGSVSESPLLSTSSDDVQSVNSEFAVNSIFSENEPETDPQPRIISRRLALRFF